MKINPPSHWPEKVKRGSVTLTIYKTTNRKNGTPYEEFKLVYYDADNRRRFESFSDYTAARRRADTVKVALSSGDARALDLTGQDRLAYLRAIDALKPTGVPLDIAAAQFADAHERLAGRSISEAVDFFVKRNPTRLPSKTVAEAVEELKKAKAADGATEVYLSDLDTRLGKFAEAFQCQISSVGAVEVNSFLRSLGCGGRSRNNYRGAIATLFKFVEAQGALPKGHLDFADVPKAKEKDFSIEIFTPDEMSALLKTARVNPDDLPNGFNRRYAAGQGLLPLLVLGAFAGLRTAEVSRQKWSDINLEEGFIRVTAAKGNTAKKRIVPISDNLKQWLLLFRREDGLCCEYQYPEKALRGLGARAGIKWKHNALRHSFISYRVAETSDVAKVSLEAGNSPRMIFTHYREVVRPKEAKEWFSITPASIAATGKIVRAPMNSKAAA